jgi:hypothetical protein
VLLEHCHALAGLVQRVSVRVLERELSEGTVGVAPSFDSSAAWMSLRDRPLTYDTNGCGGGGSLGLSYMITIRIIAQCTVRCVHAVRYQGGW